MDGTEDFAVKGEDFPAKTPNKDILSMDGVLKSSMAA